MSAMVTINNVWNSKEDKKCLGDALYYGFSMCRDMHDFDFYLGICEARHSLSFYANENNF